MNKILLLPFLAACGGATADTSSSTTPTTAAATSTAVATSDVAVRAPTTDEGPSDATPDELCLVHHFKRDYARAMTECTAACDASAKDSCKVLGMMYESGEGTAPDAARASKLYAKACSLGNAAACASVHSAPTSATAATGSGGGMHFSIGNIEADGVKLSNLSCDHVEGGFAGGLFGGIALAAGFTQRKAQLAACAAHGSTRVEWVGAAGRMTYLKATGAAGRCVERALAGAPSTITGVCSATVRHGP